MQTKPTNDKKVKRQQNTGRDYVLPGPKYWIIFFTTIILIVAMMISLVVVLCLEEEDDYEPPVSNTSGGKQTGSGTGNSIVNNNTNVKTKTGIKLPCVTAGGKLLSSSASNCSTIEDISSECAILVDINGNVSIAEKYADTLVHPASMTKVMTLLVACENIQNAGALLTIEQEMLDRRAELEGSGEIVENAIVVDSNGDTIDNYDLIGHSITAEDALYLINYQSDTVACLMIANLVAGSEEAFVAKMNQKAAQIGLSNTHFVNCTGLTESSGEHNRTTVREMAAIMVCAMKNEAARKVITSNQLYKVDLYNNSKKTDLVLSFYADWDVRRWNNRDYDQVRAEKASLKGFSLLGGKTGYEDIPTSCYVTVGRSTKTGKEYVCVTVGKALNSSAPDIKNEMSTVDAVKIYKNYIK